MISNPSDHPKAYICDECIAVCTSILGDDEVRPPVASGRPPNVEFSGGATLPGELQLQLKQVLLANRIEFAITMFENETASTVSTIIVNRTADGCADVSVSTYPR
jgi:hypothetical protein